MGLLWKWELKGGKNLEAKWAQLLPYVEVSLVLKVREAIENFHLWSSQKHRRNERVDPFYDVLLLHTLLRMGSTNLLFLPISWGHVITLSSRKSNGEAGKKEEAKEMVKGIEQSTAGMQAPRKEQLETVWVPLCQGTILSSFSLFASVDAFSMAAGIYEFFAGKREKGLELLHKTPVDHLNVRLH